MRYVEPQEVKVGEAIDGDTVAEIGYCDGVWHFWDVEGDVIAVADQYDVIPLTR